MLKRLFVICSALILAACATSPTSPSTGGERTHSYTLKHSGELQLTTPDTWQDEIKQGKNGWFPTIIFRPASGDAFQVLITPVAPPVGDPTPMPSQAKIRASIERGRDKAAPQAVEKNIVVHQLHSANAAGYYFTATDKAPGSGPDDFRVMTHFELVSGRVLLLVTAFYNDDSDKVREKTVAMLEGAQFKQEGKDEPQARNESQSQGAPADMSIRISKVPAGYNITVPVSRLELILHGSRLVQQPGGSASPRYFFFDDNARNAIISGWFDPAGEFPGIKPFWKGEARSMKEHQPPGPLHVKFEKVGKWQVVAYDMKVPGTKFSYAHLRAERVQAGTWLDLHLSMTSRLPAAKAHKKLVAVLKSIEVREKKK